VAKSAMSREIHEKGCGCLLCCSKTVFGTGNYLQRKVARGLDRRGGRENLNNDKPGEQRKKKIEHTRQRAREVASLFERKK